MFTRCPLSSDSPSPARFAAVAVLAATASLGLVGCQNAPTSADAATPVAGPGGAKASADVAVSPGAGVASPAAFVRPVQRAFDGIEVLPRAINPKTIVQLSEIPVSLPKLPPATPPLATPGGKVSVSAPTNPGVAVFLPQTPKDAPADLKDFGAGCGFYLTVSVAGNPACGPSPMMSSVGRVIKQMKFPDARLAPADAAKVARLTGATHAAVGELKEEGGKATLTYRLYTTDGKEAGQPVMLAGTRAELTAKLPTVAGGLTRALNLKAGTTPPVGTAPDELATLGKLAYGGPYSPDDEKALAGMAERVPLAAVLRLGSAQARSSASAFTDALKKSLAGYPDNAMIYAIAAYINAGGLVPVRADLQRVTTAYPKNYLLAHTGTWFARATGDPTGERKSATRAVANAPGNPDAYLSLGQTLSDSAHRVRLGKTAGQMSEVETRFVNGLYPRWYQTVRRATDLDPDHALAWQRVAQAGTFAGERDAAVKAWDRARDLKLNPYDLYVWGLQMFQPKWGGDPAKLREVATAAAKAEYANVPAAMQIVAGIQEAGLPEIAGPMADEYAAKWEAEAAKDPKNAMAFYNLAVIRKAKGDKRGTAEAFETVTGLRPDDAEAFFDLGAAYADQGMNTKAVQALTRATELDPKHERAYAEMGWVLKHMNQLPEAETVLKKALALNPDFAAAHCVLGTVYVNQFLADPTRKDRFEAAKAQYKTALAGGIFPEAYHNLMIANSKREDWDAALQNIKDLLPYRPERSAYYGMASHCYLMKKDWKAAEAWARQAVAIDPNEAGNHVNLGIALLHQKRIEEGKAACAKGLELDGGRNPGMKAEVDAALAANG